MLRYCEEMQNMSLYRSSEIIYFDINDDLEIVKSSSLYGSLVRIHCPDLEYPVSNMFEKRKLELIKLLENPKIRYISPFDPYTFRNSPDSSAPFDLLRNYEIMEAMDKILRRSKKIKLAKIKSLKGFVH